MKKTVKRLLAILMVAIIAFSNLAVCFAADTYKINVPVKYCQTEARSMLAMINTLRTGSNAWYWNSSNTQKIYPSGLKAYKYDYNLERIAMQRAAEIAIGFTHERPDGTKWTTAFNESYTRTAENIAAGTKTAATTFDKWAEAANKYENQGHRRNMLGTYVAIGIAGVYYNGAYYWVQEYGAKCVDSNSTTANDSLTSVPVKVLPSKITSKTLSLSTSALTIAVGSSVSVPVINGTMEFKDAWKNSNPVTVPCTWTSDNTSVVTISGGKLVAQNAGTATIKASAMGQNFTATVTVKGKSSGGSNTFTVTYDSNGGSVAASSAEFKKGDSVTLPNATRKGYTFLGWSPSKTTTSLRYRAGTTATFNGDTVLYAIWVKTANPPRIWGFDILPDKVSVDYKGKVQLPTVVDADNGAKYTYQWFSKDKSVAGVNQQGIVTGVKKWTKGTATITCFVTDSNGKKYSDSCEVTVGYSWKQWIINTVLLGFLWYK